MNLLLDTHALLWALDRPDQLDPRARAAIADGANRVVVSAASAWEIAIKQSIGKLRFDGDLAELVTTTGFDSLAIDFEHARSAGALPAHHRDPFDRMLIAQATCEALTIVTRDPLFDLYAVPLLAA